MNIVERNVQKNLHWAQKMSIVVYAHFVCVVARLQSEVSFSGMVTCIGDGALSIDKVVVVRQGGKQLTWVMRNQLKSQLSGYRGKDYIRQTCCPVA